MTRVTVLLGGTSSEREVSLISGEAIGKGLEARGYEVQKLDPARFHGIQAILSQIRELKTDVVFLGLHGGSGENGQFQAALELEGIPFTGSGAKACALAMDKYLSKLLAREEGIPTADYLLMREDLLNDYNDPADYQAVCEKLGLPLMVKPNDGGSSVGMTRVEQLSQLKPALKLALSHSGSTLLERFIPGRELTVTLLDGQALPLVEIRPLAGWYDYQNKYGEGRSEYLAPAPVEDALAQLIQTYAERLWQVFGLRHYARADFRFDGEHAYFLELNTLPGMTPLSLTPKAAQAIGLEFPELVDRIVRLAGR